MILVPSPFAPFLPTRSGKAGRGCPRGCFPRDPRCHRDGRRWVCHLELAQASAKDLRQARTSHYL
eukprot:3330277-Pyramimonas_sp.AAC.1